MSESRPLRLVFGPELSDTMLESVIEAMGTELQPYAGFKNMGASYSSGNRAHVDLKPIIFQDTRDKVGEIIAEIKSHYPTAKVEEVHLLAFLKSAVASQLGIPEDKVF